MRKIAAIWGLVALVLGAQCMGQTAPASQPAARGRGAGRGPQFPAIDPKLPTLWIIGDSTVRNGVDNGNNGQWGWGNPIAAYFDKTRINVQNRAVGGTSSRTFYTSATMWPAMLPLIKQGDFLIMQFGHNDANPLNDQPGPSARSRGTFVDNSERTEEIDNLLTGKHEVVHSYGWYLRNYIKEAREKGVVDCVICSPIPRNRWTGDTIGQDKFAPIAKEAAGQVKADFVDLNALVIKKYTPLGKDKVTKLYFPETPAGGAAETTHTDWAGAVLNAESVIDGLKSLDHCSITQYLLADPPKELKDPTGKAR
jgi:lysophospholipase L1-like esterase